jgi:hypothetical protein
VDLDLGGEISSLQKVGSSARHLATVHRRERRVGIYQVTFAAEGGGFALICSEAVALMKGMRRWTTMVTMLPGRREGFSDECHGEAFLRSN